MGVQEDEMALPESATPKAGVSKKPFLQRKSKSVKIVSKKKKGSDW